MLKKRQLLLTSMGNEVVADYEFQSSPVLLNQGNANVYFSQIQFPQKMFILTNAVLILDTLESLTFPRNFCQP